jgi:Domain of unknown function (DUF6968)
MRSRNIVAQAKFNIVEAKDMTLTFFKPTFRKNKNAWGCEFEFNAPLNVGNTIFGENSLQAFVLALKVASAILYGSELYKEKKIGVFGEIGGQLILPAPKALIGVAPYPF